MDAETLRQSLQEQMKTDMMPEMGLNGGQQDFARGEEERRGRTNSYLQAPQKHAAIAFSEDIVL
ncbi:hypothetical protein LTR53_016732 [Teratosphaeriaceae sp. CCFEE 6253]|nr:hypothetical protein LTR53_016732 [Teratosphaeriaceae sp. CCFEE 6253]